MARQKKTVITCAITGGIHTPTMSDALPYTPDDLATQRLPPLKQVLRSFIAMRVKRKMAISRLTRKIFPPICHGSSRPRML